MLGEQVHATLPLLLGVELVRADIAAAVLGVGLGEVPCGGPITWALLIDGAVAGRTDEPLTDDAAQDWARRMLGEGTRFQLAHSGGGYWLTDTTDLPQPPDLRQRLELPGSSSTHGGWSR
ncbi:hypothetical protein PHK61_25015 [Actinomycetospora lutea]|uniref:hypothetical protein n=1 Tax=Actinomycetospora lutea TaxID=663604 RepID=UPI002365C97E|nr:hypothetical protein [Actinomycetospora lutea]MDD7941687.1 hypothetical protein [Actinomycetospora lutea]